MICRGLGRIKSDVQEGLIRRWHLCDVIYGQPHEDLIKCTIAGRIFWHLFIVQQKEYIFKITEDWSLSLCAKPISLHLKQQPLIYKFGPKIGDPQAKKCAKHTVKWGAKNRTCLVFAWSKEGQFQNGPAFKCHLKTDLFCPDFEWLGCAPCTMSMYWKTDHLKYDLQSVWFSNVYRFSMSRVRIPTVLWFIVFCSTRRLVCYKVAEFPQRCNKLASVVGFQSWDHLKKMNS